MQLDRQTVHKGTSLIRYFVANKAMTAALARRKPLKYRVLDVTFSADHSLALQVYSAENLATSRQIPLNLFKQDTTEKLGINNKCKGCG